MLQSLLSKVACLQAENRIKKRLQHKCFPVNIAPLTHPANVPILYPLKTEYEMGTLAGNGLIALSLIYNCPLLKVVTFKTVFAGLV